MQEELLWMSKEKWSMFHHKINYHGVNGNGWQCIKWENENVEPYNL